MNIETGLKKDPKPHKPELALIAGAASLGAVVILIGIKFYGYMMTGSTAMLATLIDSTVDASASLTTFLAIRLSLKPADTEHRFGHGKVEGLAAILQAIFISGAGCILLYQAINRFASASPVTNEMTAIWIMAVSIVISALLVMVQKYTLRHAPSLAVEADQAHFSMDILVNLAVIAVMVVIHLGGPTWPDPVLAVLVTIYLAMIAKDIAMKGLDMLFDRELSGITREIITKKVLSHQGVLGMHDLRTRKSGMAIFLSFDIEVDGDLPLREAHDIARDVEHALIADFPHAEIFIHVDPSGDIEDTRHQVAGVHDL